MINSHEVINLESMAQCLDDARALLRDGDMCADTYVSLLEEAARLIRSVLAFAQDVGLEIKDGDEQEAWKIVDRYKVVKDHHASVCFQGGDWDLYLDLQDPWDTLVLEPQSRASEGACESSLRCYWLKLDGEALPVENYRNFCHHAHDDETESLARVNQIRSWLAQGCAL